MHAISNKINLAILSACILLFIFLPVKKNIWYDEAISVLCSQGINYSSGREFEHTKTITSKDIQAFNDNSHIFKATVMDNSNSFLYNIGMHYFTGIFGTSLTTYILFSRLWGIAALIALFFLSRLLFGNDIFVSIAVMLLFTDTTFWGMGNEIRAYAMGVFFVMLAAIYFFKYTLQNASPANLLFFGLSSVAAILTHFFCAYIIAVLALALFVKYKQSLFAKKNVLSIFIPVAILAIYFGVAYSGLSPKNIHTVVVNNKDTSSYDLTGMLFRFMKFTAVNFKIVYARFHDAYPVVTLSFLLLLAIYAYGVKLLNGKTTEKYKFRLLFMLGIISSIFLTIISIKNHTFSSFYYRYFIFSVPFTALFIAMFIRVFFEHFKGKALLNVTVAVIFIAPPVFLFVISAGKLPMEVKYNHMTIAEKIIKENITRIEVPAWDEAFLIQSFLPKNCNVTYMLNTTSQNFRIYKENTTEVIPLIRNNS